MKLCERPSLFVSVSSSSTEKRAKKKKQNALKRFSQRALLFFSPFFTQASKFLPVRALLAMGQVRFPLVFVTSQREEVKLLNAIASRCSLTSLSPFLFFFPSFQILLRR